MDYWTLATTPAKFSMEFPFKNDLQMMNYWRKNNCSWELTKHIFIRALCIFSKKLEEKADGMTRYEIDYFKITLNFISENIGNNDFSKTSMVEPIIYEFIQFIGKF